MHSYLNISKSAVNTYNVDSSAEDLSICHCSSNSLCFRKYEPDCLSVSCMSKSEKSELLLLHSNIDNIENSKPTVVEHGDYFNPNKQLTCAFMTGDLFSFKQNLEHRLGSTNLTLIGKEDNAIHSSASNYIRDPDVFCPKQRLNSPINSEIRNSAMKCKESNLSLDERSVHYEQFSKNECEKNNGEGSINCKSLESLAKSQIKTYAKTIKTNVKYPKSQPGTLSWVKPFKVINKTKLRNKKKDYTKKKLSTKTILKNSCEKKLRKNSETNKAHTVEKKINRFICVGTQCSDIFSHETISAQTDLNENDTSNVTKIDINLKNSEQLVAVADLVIEALNQNLKCPSHTPTEKNCHSKILKKSWLTQDSITIPGMIKQFSHPQKKKPKTNDLKKLSEQPSKSVQFCLDKFASAFEKELRIRLGKVKEKVHQSYYPGKKHKEINFHCSEDMFRKFEKEFDEEISKIKGINYS